MPERFLEGGRHLALITCAVLGAAMLQALEIPPPSGAPRAMLRLSGDAHVTGELRPSTEPGILLWDSPSFARPLAFPLDAVMGVDFPPLPEPAKRVGEYCFELAGGDVVFGSLLGLNGEEAELELALAGRVRVRLDHIRSIYRLNVAELIHVGPNGLSDWKDLGGAREWKEEGGQPLTDQAGAALFADFGIPARAVLELELSWDTHPDFTLALGVTEDAGILAQAFRMEVLWRPASHRVIVPDARQDPVEWEYTFRNPGGRWFDPAFKPEGWRTGPAGFGTEGTPGAIVRTEWSTKEIWMRRRFELHGEQKSLALSLHHDEDVRVWLNGHLVHEEKGFISDYRIVTLDRAARFLREGENILAVHCRQSGGGQYVDVGIVDQGETRGELVAIRETDREADVAPIQPVTFEAGRTHLLVYLDQQIGQMLIYTPAGVRVADLAVAPQGPGVAGGLKLTNNRGDVRLERLRISRWNGAPPDNLGTDRPRLYRIDGSMVPGALALVDPVTKELIVREGNEEVRVPADQVASVVLSAPPGDPARGVRAVYRDGTRLSGELNGIEGDHVTLASPGIGVPLRLPIAGLSSLAVLKRSEKPAPPLSAGPVGTLEMEGVHLPGRLVDGREEPDASCLVWQPIQARAASPLRPGATGRILYREPAPLPAPPQPVREVSFLRRLFRSLSRKEIKADPAREEGRQRSLHLRNGDAIPCEVSRIDEQGVRFKTPSSDAALVAHDRVKAVELVHGKGPPKLSKAKRERLLMLPRLQTPAPPTHLIRSTGGDFLRGNLISLDEKVLRVEIRSEPREIPRERVSHIIWLHKDELPKPAPPAETTPPAPGAAVAAAPALEPPPPAPSPPAVPALTRVQVQESAGTLLTFLPRQVEGTILSGTSDVLGTCRADLTAVDQVWVGGGIQPVRPRVAYQDWRLYRATEPVYIQVLDGPRPEAPTPGIDSSLVGKPAPDFELDLLDGRKFRLSSTRGRVVILDFWASWCGPCLQNLPQIDRMVRELDDSNVELIAVNLEEPAAQITPVLERHKLQMRVALDRDGVVAARYEAVSIPQTVVIDREGKIVRLFVGGGPQLAEQLRNAVRDLLPVEEKPG